MVENILAGKFGTLSNIYDGAFSLKKLTVKT